MQIDVTSQIPELRENIVAIRQRLNGDLTPLMTAIGTVLENSTRQRFADKKSPNDVTWRELVPKTVKYKVNKQATKKGVTAVGILVEQGNLFKSITFEAGGDSVVVGTPLLYGKYHQTGTKHMVARPFLGVSAQDEVDIRDMINDFMAGNLN